MESSHVLYDVSNAASHVIYVNSNGSVVDLYIVSPQKPKRRFARITSVDGRIAFTVEGEEAENGRSLGDAKP